MTNNNGHKLFRFLDWSVYIETRRTCKAIFGLINKLSPSVRITLGNQIMRSSTSILLNIAEGSGKNSDTELNRYFNIATGSINETVANLDLLRDNNFITEVEFTKIFGDLESISKQLGGFKKVLKR